MILAAELTKKIRGIVFRISAEYCRVDDVVEKPSISKFVRGVLVAVNSCILPRLPTKKHQHKTL